VGLRGRHVLCRVQTPKRPAGGQRRKAAMRPKKKTPPVSRRRALVRLLAPAPLRAGARRCSAWVGRGPSEATIADRFTFSFHFSFASVYSAALPKFDE
jgi:hypothetical protein